MEVRVPTSTVVMAVPDFSRMLKPGEIYLGFYQGSPDNRRPCLVDTDVLVGRYPMHRPSDVQRVRAVYRSTLSYTYDVIVFPITGKQALADLLSNGDYDGDRFWVCWEASLVRDFSNARAPYVRSPESLGIRKNLDTLSTLICDGGVDEFLNKCFAFQMEDRLLGMCANFQETFAYATRSIRSDKFMLLADLRDHLVDATKQGYLFSFPDWRSFLQRNKLKDYPVTAYKSTSQHPKSEEIAIDHVVDYLKFKIIVPAIKDFQACAKQRFGGAQVLDPDLDRLYETKYTMSLAKNMTGVRQDLEHLQDDIESLIQEWNVRREAAPGLENYGVHLVQAYLRYMEIRPRKNTHMLVQEWYRGAMAFSPSVWSLLKASSLHATIAKTLSARAKTKATEHLSFALAGRELLYMKSYEANAGALTVIPEIFHAMKMRKGRC